MKGLIAYSSLTGNTKKYAQKLAEGLSDMGAWTVVDMKDQTSLEGFDCVLIGAWIDRSHFNQKAIAWVMQQNKEIPVGFFGTLGAMPDSQHGKDVKDNIEKEFADFKIIGTYLLPGLVDPAVVKRVEKMPDHVLPEPIRQAMIDAGKASRYATEDEYQSAIDYFKKALQTSQI